MKKMESVSNKQNAKSHKIPNEIDEFCAERYFLDFIEAHPRFEWRERDEKERKERTFRAIFTSQQHKHHIYTSSNSAIVNNIFGTVQIVIHRHFKKAYQMISFFFSLFFFVILMTDLTAVHMRNATPLIQSRYVCMAHFKYKGFATCHLREMRLKMNCHLQNDNQVVVIFIYMVQWHCMLSSWHFLATSFATFATVSKYTRNVFLCLLSSWSVLKI